MILYHGSNIIIGDIDLEKSKPNKDFGKGFYLSESEEQAMEMALFKSALLGGDAITQKDMTPEDFKYMIETMAADLAELLSKDFNMTISQALDALYNSVTYEKLILPESGLYFQSTLYVYSFLKEEMLSGKFFVNLQRNID